MSKTIVSTTISGSYLEHYKYLLKKMSYLVYEVVYNLECKLHHLRIKGWPWILGIHNDFVFTYSHLETCLVK